MIGPLSQSLVPSLCQQNLSGQVVKTEVDTRRKVFLLVASDGPTLTWTCSLPVCVYLQSVLPTFSMLVAFKKRPFWQIQDVESYVHMSTIVCIYLHIYIFIRVYIYLFIYLPFLHIYIYILFGNETLQWEFLYKRKFIAGKIIELFRVICQQATCDEMGGYIEYGNSHDISLVGGLEHEFV